MNRSGLSIYLQLSPQGIYDRLQTSKSQRPLLQGLDGDELLDFISVKLKEREPFYKKAMLIADAEKWKVDDFIDAILKYA
ncbi:shikimate kinase [Saccharicrinis fermentans DSM 9555 = JCM 21142]|uniref:Shikimate kinase n=2 Tax=Saccharicrinis fermentans TaxID=982 RepID=W7Y4B2_9BACT|nr:shikimate kinase [Saccharicrinis fermentans DSM 9555 = JCM 21142]